MASWAYPLPIDSGQARCLKRKTASELGEIRAHAEKLGLGINLEISSGSKDEVADVVRIARTLNAQVHLKGIRRIRHLSGFVQLGVAQGEDDLPQMKMLLDLLMLGEDEPQVETFSLEQEIGYTHPFSGSTAKIRTP